MERNILFLHDGNPKLKEKLIWIENFLVKKII